MRLTTVVALLLIGGGILSPDPVAAEGPSHCDGHVATIVGTAGVDHLVGTSGPDVILGGRGADVIDGRGGDDLICGATGSDRIHGGSGADTIYSGRGSHGDIRGGRGDDRLYGQARHNVLRGGPGDDVLINQRGAMQYHREPGHDTIRDDAADLLILAFRHSPVGVDVAAGPHGHIRDLGSNRLITGPATRLHVQGSPYDDNIVGGPAGDTIYGSAGNDLILGRGGHDLLIGSDGRRGAFPSSRANPETDTVLGGADADDIVVSGLSTARGGPGNDSLRLRNQFGHLAGGDGDDMLTVQKLVLGGAQTIDVGTGANGLDIGLTHPAGTTTGWSHVAVDLAAGRLDADGQIMDFSGPLTSLRVRDRDSYRAGSWDVTGTEDDDQIAVNEFGGSGPVTEHGLGGDDYLASGLTDDFLDGGPGTDLADAGLGTDTCVSIEGSLLPNEPNYCDVSTP